MAFQIGRFALASLLLSAMTIAAQQPGTALNPDVHRIRLNVAVDDGSGNPVTSLRAEDFTLLDNGQPRTINSFRAVSAGHETTSMILVLDAVNARFSTVSYARDQIKQFLLADGGRLAVPMTICVLTDNGAQLHQGFTRDGKVLEDALEHYDIGLRSIGRSSGIYGADERVGISLKALTQVLEYDAALPGRKLVLWISPGWPLLSGPRIDLTSQQQQNVFRDVVHYSTELRRANVTLYDINPLGPEENLLQQTAYKEFLKGIKKPGETDLADISLQVMAVQSGGLTLQGTSDIRAMLDRTLRDAQSWYEVDFVAAPGETPNEYHQVSIKVNRPGLTARTSHGYYAQPEAGGRLGDPR